MAEKQNDQNTLRPLVLIHRKPFFNLKPLTDLITQHFTVLDPHTQPQIPNSQLRSVRSVVIFGPVSFTAENILSLPSLKLVVATSAGIDHIDFEACRNRGIRVSGIGDSFTENVADLGVAMLIDVLRRVSAGDRFVRSGSWPIDRQFPLGSKVGGKRIGIVGLGRIGSAVAKRLVGFGCKIGYTSKNDKPSVPFPYFSTALELASESDALVVCCALTEKTRHIINKSVMEALGKEGVIVNVGRGALVDEPELIGFLTRGEIRGAGLDVFENEPNVPRELFDLDNVVLSPHAAVVTPEAIDSVNKLVIENLKAFFCDKPLLSPIQF